MDIIKNSNLDCFYTSPDNVNLCLQIYSNLVNINKDLDVIIEPSAGEGAFINGIKSLCKNAIFIDVYPKHGLIKKQNFLEFKPISQKFRCIHVIGNPPFSLNKKFILKACSLANFIGFILPLSFVKDSRKKMFPLNFHCIQEHILKETKFSFCNSWREIPTVFQV